MDELELIATVNITLSVNTTELSTYEGLVVCEGNLEDDVNSAVKTAFDYAQHDMKNELDDVVERFNLLKQYLGAILPGEELIVRDIRKEPDASSRFYRIEQLLRAAIGDLRDEEWSHITEVEKEMLGAVSLLPEPMRVQCITRLLGACIDPQELSEAVGKLGLFSEKEEE